MAVVLIETYWNVKTDTPGRRLIKLIVLIETYWNVKKVTARVVETGLSINRNILECKETKIYSIRRGWL